MVAQTCGWESQGWSCSCHQTIGPRNWKYTWCCYRGPHFEK